jgi:copper chaperone NosL
MTGFSSRVLPLALLAVVLVVVGSAIAFSVLASAKLPDGPVDVVWDKAACSACGMHVGEPPFAAQLTAKDGRTHAFDDPGCLFLYVEEHRPDVHSIYFHDHRGDRWIAADRVAFVAIDKTPMGFGIGAVDVGTPGAISLDEARRKCLERLTGHGGR